jgi:hypothetical protein
VRQLPRGTRSGVFESQILGTSAEDGQAIADGKCRLAARVLSVAEKGPGAGSVSTEKNNLWPNAGRWVTLSSGQFDPR